MSHPTLHRRVARNVTEVVAAGFATLLLSGCAPEIGSQAWCEKMQETPKGEWTMNAAADYAKHCVLKLEEN